VERDKEEIIKQVPFVKKYNFGRIVFFWFGGFILGKMKLFLIRGQETCRNRKNTIIEKGRGAYEK